MTEKRKNPNYVSDLLCSARMENLTQQIKSIRTQIIFFTTFIQILIGVIMLLLNSGR